MIPLGVWILQKGAILIVTRGKSFRLPLKKAPSPSAYSKFESLFSSCYEYQSLLYALGCTIFLTLLSSFFFSIVESIHLNTSTKLERVNESELIGAAHTDFVDSSTLINDPPPHDTKDAPPHTKVLASSYNDKSTLETEFLDIPMDHEFKSDEFFQMFKHLDYNTFICKFEILILELIKMFIKDEDPFLEVVLLGLWSMKDEHCKFQFDKMTLDALDYMGYMDSRKCYIENMQKFMSWFIINTSKLGECQPYERTKVLINRNNKFGRARQYVELIKSCENMPSQVNLYLCAFFNRVLWNERFPDGYKNLQAQLSDL